MVKRFLKLIHKDEKGITGLETAIILIAFVVVAAVFAFTALSAGLFSTEKSKEAVYSGLKEAQSTMELKGNVVALDNGGTADEINKITFTIAMSAGGEAMDFTAPLDDAENGGQGDGLSDSDSTNSVIINVSTINETATDVAWTKTAIGTDDGDNLLDPGEQFLITIGGATAGTDDLEGALGTNLDENDEFRIQVIPQNGATLVIEKTLPAVIDDVNNLN